MNKWSFYFMSFWFYMRDINISPIIKLQNSGIIKGHNVMDYGCGPGGFSIAASRLTGKQGTVYAVDRLQIAIDTTRRKAMKRGLNNLQTILTDCYTGIPDQTIDVVILHDVYHELTNPQSVMAELYRVAKAEAVLWFSDHHMDSKAIKYALTTNNLFQLINYNTYSYICYKT